MSTKHTSIQHSCEENNNTSLAVCSLDYLSVCLFVGLSVSLAVCTHI